MDEIRNDLNQILKSVGCDDQVIEFSSSCEVQQRTELKYFKLAVEPCDLLTLLLPMLGVHVERVSRDASCEPQKVLVNCLNVSDHRLEWFLDDAVPDSGRTLVCSEPLPSQSESWGRVVQLPCSFRELQDAILAATQGA